MLTTIHISVRDRVPTITAGEDVISHNSDYAVEFEFDEEWQDKIKTVYFVCEDGSYQAVVMDGNSCGVPMMAGEQRRIFVGVQAGSAEKPSVLKTTRPCCLKVKDSIADYLGQPIPDPTPDVYEQIIAMLESITSPTWDALQDKPFSTLGSGLAVDENGVLSAQGGSGGSANAVQYVAQTLTDEQKAQARDNIGADKKRIVVEARRSSGGSTMVYYNVDDQNAAIDKFIAEYKAGTEILLRLYNRDYPLTNIDENGIVYFSGYIYDAANKSVGVIVYKMEKNKAVVEESSLYGIKAISLDNQLKYKGYAADAKAVGDALENFVTANELQNYVSDEELQGIFQQVGQVLDQKLDKNQGTANAGKILGIGEDGIVVPQDKPTYTLPQATADVLGGIKADAATAEDTQVVRIGADGKLRTKPTGGSSITVDSALSSTSTNPVQNKVVTTALAGKITAPTTAAVGQIIKVKSVDGTGKPTEWEAADLPSGSGEKQFAVIFEQLLDNSTVVSVDDDGTYNEVIIELLCPPGAAAAFSKFTIILGVGNTVNGIAIANASGNNKGFWLHVTRCIDTDGVKCIQGEYMSANMANAASITAKSSFNNHTAKAIISPIKTDLMTAGILFRSGIAIPAGSMLRISAK